MQWLRRMYIMDRSLLDSIDKMAVLDARALATSMLKTPNSRATVRQKMVIGRLIRDIADTHTSAEVTRIMWNVYMSKSGFGIPNSAWKTHYRSA